MSSGWMNRGELKKTGYFSPLRSQGTGLGRLLITWTKCFGPVVSIFAFDVHALSRKLQRYKIENFMRLKSFQPFNRYAPFKRLTLPHYGMRDRRRYLHWVFEAKKRLGLWMRNYIEGWFIWPEPSSTLHALRRLKDSNPSRQRKLVLEGVPVIPSLMLNALHHRREEGTSLPDPPPFE